MLRVAAPVSALGSSSKSATRALFHTLRHPLTLHIANEFCFICLIGSRPSMKTARVLKPGGRVFLVDVDFDSMAIYSTHPALTRKIIAAIAGYIPNRNSARDLPALARQAGLRDLSIGAYAITTPYEFLVHGISGALNREVVDGLLSRAELEQWLAEQANLQARGAFFHMWLAVRCSGAL